MNLLKDTNRFATTFPVVEDWGIIPYQEAFTKQKHYVEEIIKGERKETLILCSHPPVVTLGRGTKPNDVFSWQGETVEVNRGGRATYHGPNQVVLYPMIDLAGNTPNYIPKKVKSLHGFMRCLEEAAVQTLREYDVEAQGHSLQTQVGEDEAAEATGVWVGEQKIASIGIAARKWVTYHGIAINLFKDPDAFQGINPCGFTSKTMVCLQELTPKRVKREAFQKELISNFIFSLLK